MFAAYVKISCKNTNVNMTNIQFFMYSSVCYTYIHSIYCISLNLSEVWFKKNYFLKNMETDILKGAFDILQIFALYYLCS